MGRADKVSSRRGVRVSELFGVGTSGCFIFAEEFFERFAFVAALGDQPGQFVFAIRRIFAAVVFCQVFAQVMLDRLDELAHCLEAVSRLLRQHLLKHVAEPRRRVRSLLAKVRNRSTDVRHQCVRDGLSRVRRFRPQQEVQRASQRINIRSHVRFSSVFNLLGGHKPRGAEHLPRHRQTDFVFVRLVDSRQPHVQNFDASC